MSFRVACCQVRAFDLEDAEENLANILRALDEAGAAGARLVALPECSYPAYYVRDADPYARPGVRPFADVAALFAEKAKRYGYWLAAGMAVPHEGRRLTNSGLVFGPDGEVRGRYDKAFLWHFDNDWFDRGNSFPTWDTGFCRFGILICADGRQPEVARMLRVNGADVILDLTAWVSWGRTTADLSTPQCEYLMPVRALENGAWVVAADKWGAEDGTIIYAGRSCVIDPTGTIRTVAPSDREAVVVYDIDLAAAAPVPVARRPELYGLLTAPTASLPAVRSLDEPIVPAREERRIAVVPGDGEYFDAARVLARYASLRRQGVDLAVLGGMPGPEGWQVALPGMQSEVARLGGALAFAVSTAGCLPTHSMALVTPDGIVEHQASHGRGIGLGEIPPPVVATPVGNVGLLCGDEGLVPEVPRALMLGGAEFLAWSLFAPGTLAESVVRARSDENRVYTAAAWDGGGIIAAPTGAVLTAVPAGTGVAMAAGVNRTAARLKSMAPGTSALVDRQPEAYVALTKPQR